MNKKDVMNKWVLTLMLLNTAVFLSAQASLYPDTLIRKAKHDYALVYRDCNACLPAEKNRVVRRYTFNDKGLNYMIENLDTLMQANSRTLIFYKEGQMSSYENYTTYVSVDFKKAQWDSTLRTSKIVYKYNDKKQIQKVIWLTEEDRLEFDVTFEYDNLNRITKETQRWYIAPDVISLEMFNPRTASFMDSVKIQEDMRKEKLYSYSGRNCEIAYFVDSKQTGIEERVYTANNLLETSLSKNMNGDTLKYQVFSYDAHNRIVKKESIDTGYDAFGTGFDYLDYDRVVYKYDEKEKLQMLEYYNENKLFFVDKYKYFDR